MTFDSSSRILITGGTGSFGKAFISETFRRFPEIKRLVMYSRDEHKQWELQQLYPESQYQAGIRTPRRMRASGIALR